MFLFPMPIAPHSLPPNPSLVAIILIITTRRGPRFVFHYPGTPEPSQPSNSWAFGSIGSDSEDSDDGGSSDDATVTSDTGDERSGGGASRANSVGSREGGAASWGGGGGIIGGGGKSGSRGKASVSVATSNSRRTTRTLREDGPEDEEDADDDIEALDLSATENGGGGKNERGGVEGDGRGGSGGKDALAEWEKLLGYPTEGLEKLLSPPDKFRRRKFEVSVEDLVFLGYPVFAKEDGTWKKKEKGKAKTRDGDMVEADEDGNSIITEKNPFTMREMNGKANADLDNPALRDASSDDAEISPTTSRHDLRQPNNIDAATIIQDTDAISNSYGSTGGLSETVSEDKSVSSTSGSQGGDDMSMFHLVFVMNPPTLEYHIRVQEMYDNVVKKFSKALKYEQVNSGWVEKEAMKILTMKNQAKESKTRMPMSVLWARILQQSSLAKAIANVYTSIASNKIAHVSIGASFAASIQIPQAISTSYVATPMEPQLPGLWLTTASMLEDDDGVPTLSPHAALLLLEDKETILKEIESDNKDANDPLAYFIRALSPTKSLQKLSTSLSLSLSDMQFLARHLIYWRRARAVPPLHIRDTYIVSPNCDLKQLAHATTLYAQKFPSLPSLPSMLQLLSTKPRQYGYLIPSKDHKAAYMEILAWLLRGGWVTQLRTFAWVKITPAIKAAAAVQVRKEAEDRATAAAAKASLTAAASSSRPDMHASQQQRQQRAVDLASPRPARRTYSEDDYMSSTSTSRKSSRSKASPRLDALLSPTIRMNALPRDRHNSVGGSSDTESIASNRTTIPPPQLCLSSPTLIPLRPSPLHTVDNINPLSPPPGTAFPATTASQHPTTSSSSSASVVSSTLDIHPSTADPLFAAPPSLTPTSTSHQPSSTSSSHPSAAPPLLPSTDPSTYTTTLLLSPHKASALESKYLALIAAGLGDKDLKDMWGTLVGYFDGGRAVEEIAGREGLKRRRVDGLMARLEAEGVLVVVRHW